MSTQAEITVRKQGDAVDAPEVTFDPAPPAEVEMQDIEVEVDDRGAGQGDVEEDEAPAEDEAGGGETEPLNNKASDAEESVVVKKSRFQIEDGAFPFQQSKIYLFIKDDIQWSVVFFLCQLFFWIYGYPVYSEYGYRDWDSPTRVNVGSDGEIASGPSGSGIVLITLMLMFFASLIWVSRFIMYDAQKAHPEIQVLGWAYLCAGDGSSGYDDD